MPAQKYFIVDAFTDAAFAGNPAAVVPFANDRDDCWRKNIAREMNLSETAFLSRAATNEGLQLRWFTPAVEVDLCGHATLATAHILWSEGYLPDGKPLAFETRSGRLTASRRGTLIELDFPSVPATAIDPPPGLLAALGISNATFVGRSRFDMLVEVDDESVVRGLNPQMHELKNFDVRGVIVTSRADGSDHDFVSRFFAPAAGVDEDPVTGSAHCCLGPYWQERLGKREFTAYQASPRGGVVHVRVDGDRSILGGHAVTVCRGEFALIDAFAVAI